MAIITSPTGAQILTGTDSARPRKGETPAADPGFASLLAMLVSGVAPALPPAGIGNQPQPESRNAQALPGLQLPSLTPRPDLGQLTRTMMQEALDQMGPALLDGPPGPTPAEALKVLAGMGLSPQTEIDVEMPVLLGTPGPDLTGLAETEGIQPQADPLRPASAEPVEGVQAPPLQQAGRPELVVLSRPVAVVERVVIAERATGPQPPEPPGQVQATGTVESPATPAPASTTAENARHSGQEPDLPDSPAPPELAPERPDAPPDSPSEWTPASPANQAGPAGPPQAEGSSRAAAETPAPLRHLAAEPIAPERLVAALRDVAAGSEPGTYEITLRLSPESLGEVKVTLQLNGSEVRTVMEVAGAEARQALESGADRLRQGLSQAGLTLSDFQVNTGLGGQQGRNPTAEWPEWLRPPARRRSGTTSPGLTSAPIPGSSPRTRTAGGRLDTLA